MKPRMTDVVLPPTFEQTAGAGTSTQNIGQVLSEKGQVLSENKNKSGVHTAGPWFYSQESIDPEWYIVTIEGGLIVANVNAHFHQEANARLIATAPELLAALAGIVDLQGKSAGGFPLSESELREWSVANHKARAAIAKAKGGVR